MNIKNELLLRLYIVLLGFIIIAGGLLYQAVKISLIEGETWREKGNSLYRKYMPVEAERGSILSSDGRPLAVSQPFFDIAIDPSTSNTRDFERNVDSLAYYISKYLRPEITPERMASMLRAKRKKGQKYLIIKRKATFSDRELAKSFPLFRLGRIKGGMIVERNSNVRLRPYKHLAARTIGIAREENPVGLEASFNKILAGYEGKQLKQRIGSNEWIPVHNILDVAPKRGNDLFTTIDIQIQDQVESALLKSLKHHEAAFGAAIVMEVKTGAIKAIANLNRGDDGYWEVYNYAVGRLMEPGSTFKLASVTALLEDKAASPDTWVKMHKGKARFYGEWMHDSSPHGLESAPLSKAFALSSNIGIAYIVDKYYNNRENADRFINKLKKFGLTEKTNIELPGEPDPFIKNAYDYSKNWSKTSLPWMAHGYELTLTPLQLLSFYNTIANNGQRMKPYLVNEIRSGENVVKKFGPQILDAQIASLQTIKAVQKMLVGVVENGTAAHLKSPLLRFAAKTGTAKVDYYNPENEDKYLSSIVGYFPAEVPKYSCIVLIGKPSKNDYYGGKVAGPVFKEIAENMVVKLAVEEPLNKGPLPQISQLSIPNLNIGFREDYEKLLGELSIVAQPLPEFDWVKLVTNPRDISFKARIVKKNEVPNVIGMGARDAIYLMERAGIRVEIKGAGKVIKQSILPGKPVRNQKVRLTLG